ncbi:MAG: SDR family NAD(P)-dependent oxidoreductase [Halieaceae bacterium]|nr:SDR family NAD(P)-dependent oxidoreductase [Halieaceae bacterium]
MSLSGKVAVVTGGGSGIGRAICVRLARDGAAVSIWDLNGEAASETAGMIEDAGSRAICCVGDASAAEQIASNAETTRDALGCIQILVNNAGISDFCRFQDITAENLSRILDVNVKGPFYCTQAIIPDMLEAGWGRIVNISSSSAQTGSIAMTHYSASKGAIITFTKSLAKEFAGAGITVNNIPPGFIDTPMLRASPVDVDMQSENSPMGRPGRPDDIAAACAYLVSDDAGYVTGQTIGVNGGRVIL